MRHALLLLPTLLTACGKGVPENMVQLEWKAGDEFYVAASYRVAAAKTEEPTTDLDGSMTSAFGEMWTDDLVWTYQVVEAGYTPDASDELYRFAQGPKGTERIAVIRASLDPSLNDDETVVATDPVVYLVFREERNRLAGMVSYFYRDGERVEQAWSTTELSRSWSPLSQSMLTAAPTYLAPWSARYEDDERALENGSLLTTSADGAKTVDVYYDDEVGGGLVVSRYEKGQPWPTWTVSDNVDARLLDSRDVESRRRVAIANDAPDDFDYRAALSASVDIEASLTLDGDFMEQGWSDQVYDGYEPWAGSWWPLKSAKLVFAESGTDTLSDRIKADIDPIKTDLDALSEAIRGLSDGAEKDAKVSEYQAKQDELVTKLVDFYGQVLADLDGGRLTIANGKLTHADGWSFDLDDLSPLDKFALAQYDRGATNPNPFYAGAWEILNHYNPGGGSWWGHCNGWAAAAILTNEPRSSKSGTIRGESVDWTVADQKGLLSEAHYSTYSRFYGARYDGPEDDISDLSPAAFTRLVTFYVRDQGVPFVFDTTAGDEVWNFPAWRVELDVNETSEANQGYALNVNVATVDELVEYLDFTEELAAELVHHREINGPFQTVEAVKDVKGMDADFYDVVADLLTVDIAERTFDVTARVTLTSDGVSESHVDSGEPESIEEVWRYSVVTDAKGLILRGTWDDNEKHPDFAWVPYDNPTSGTSSSENPYLNYGALLDILGPETLRK